MNDPGLIVLATTLSTIRVALIAIGFYAVGVSMGITLKRSRKWAMITSIVGSACLIASAIVGYFL